MNKQMQSSLNQTNEKDFLIKKLIGLYPFDFLLNLLLYK